MKVAETTINIIYFPSGENFLPDLTSARDAERQIIKHYERGEYGIYAETEIVPAQRNGQEVYKIRVSEWNIPNVGGKKIERSKNGLPFEF